MNPTPDAWVGSELAGVETHGVRPMDYYIRGINAGELKPTAKREILRETAPSALITGNWGWVMWPPSLGLT